MKLRTAFPLVGFCMGLFLMVSSCGRGLCPDGGCPGEIIPFNGRVELDGAVRAIAENPATRDVYLAGNFQNRDGISQNFLIRLNSDGTFDSDFDIGTGFDVAVETIALSLDGSGDLYVGGGFSLYKGAAATFLVRLNSDGSRDTAFNPATFGGTVRAIAVPNNGSGDIYAAGDNRIVRYNSNGATFGGGFTAMMSSGVGNSFGYALAITTNNLVYLGGHFDQYNGVASPNIVRFSSNGTRDATFDVSGGGFNNDVLAITIASDGSGDVYAGGLFATYKGTAAARLVRLNANGSLDSGFAYGSGFNGAVDGLALTRGGTNDIVVAGNFTTYQGDTHTRLVRLNSNGSVDSNFDLGDGFNGETFTIVASMSTLREFFVGGMFTAFDTSSFSYIVRLSSDGYPN